MLKERNMKNIFYLVLVAISLISCNQSGNRKEDQSGQIKQKKEIEIKYAKGFTVSDYGEYKLIDMQDPTGENMLTYKYAFVKRDADRNEIPSEYQIIEVPLKRVVCMTSLQISNFIKLNATDRIVGMNSTRFLFNEQLNDQLKTGKTSKIGIEGEFDSELVMALDPAIILVSPFKRGGYDAISDLGIPLVCFLGYKESSPLGQAEWIKFTGMLLGLEEQAFVLFDQIEQQYNQLKSLVENIEKRPVVMSGELHSGNWYVVGGKSYLAQLFRDAGADYFMKNDDESGGFNVDFETVYSQGAHADYWRIVNSFNGTFGYDELKKSDSRYIDFDAFRNRKVIYCNLREKPFYENTPVEPEVVLADLIKIFYPGLLPEHEPVYYDLLEP